LIRIGVDAMGGDYAPRSVVEGSILATLESQGKYQVVLVGDKKRIEEEFKQIEMDIPDIEIVNASQVIEMNDPPVESLKKKRDSSISVITRCLGKGEFDGIVSAGNTGAFMASTLLSSGKIEGVIRPTIGSYMPGEKNISFILDVGANSNCKPAHLLQFGIMGSIFVSTMLKRKNPKVGLLSIGEESSKGNELTIESYKLFEKSCLNFIGNIEGGDIFKGKADVIVCDGFVGNIILKFTESIIDMVKEKLKVIMGNNFITKLGILLVKPALQKMSYLYDYQEYGGVPLLGVKGTAIIGHGGSSSKAIKNAILEAYRMIRENINGKIAEKLSSYVEVESEK